MACLVAEGMKLFSYAHVNYCCRHLLLNRGNKCKDFEIKEGRGSLNNFDYFEETFR